MGALTGWFIAGFVTLRVLGIAFVVLLVARIAASLRGHRDGALGVAARRFAGGEITEEQFRRIRDVLDS